MVLESHYNLIVGKKKKKPKFEADSSVLKWGIYKQFQSF